MNFIFSDNVRILCLSCNVKKVGKLVRFKQKGQKQSSFLAFHKCCQGYGKIIFVLTFLLLVWMFQNLFLLHIAIILKEFSNLMQKICINFIIYAGGTVSSLINVCFFLFVSLSTRVSKYVVSIPSGASLFFFPFFHTIFNSYASFIKHIIKKNTYVTFIHLLWTWRRMHI
jgi:hypothetical protein